jgi:FixJ family two-component response regulator
MSQPIVFVVDDDESMRRALARLIRTAGLEVEAFRSAQAFLDQPLPDRPACLVLDLRLQGSSGLDLQTELIGRKHYVPIIFITAYGDIASTVSAMKQGAVDFLEKPFKPSNLLDCIRRALALSQKQRAEQKEAAELERRFATLTLRERDVLMQVVTGKLNKQIASDLASAEKTIKVHRGRVMKKMGAGSVADLVRMTQKLGGQSTLASSTPPP